MEAWRSANAPVIYLTVGARKADLSDAPPHLKAFFKICNNYDGSFENSIVGAPAHRVYLHLPSTA